MTTPSDLLPSSSPQLPTDPVLRHVLGALLRNRTPGFHFPANFLHVSYDLLDAAGSRMSMPVGEHNSDAHGEADGATLAVFADMAVSTSVRASEPRPLRMATVTLHLQLFAAPHAGRLEASCVLDQRMTGIAGQQSVASAVVRNGDGQTVCLARGAFVLADLQAGATLPIMPKADPHEAPALPDPARLQGEERRIYRRALAARAAGGIFGDAFWDMRVRRTAAGASGRLPATTQVGNRVAHVQGGMLMTLADRTARATLDGEWRLASVAACFLRPGLPPAVRAVAQLVHKGRTTAVVRVQLLGADRKAVLETTLAYALRRS